MKVCTGCSQAKPINDFYKAKSNADGYANRCKECAKAAARQNRMNRLDEAREYDRQRANLPHRVHARTQYCKTDAYTASHAKSCVRYSINHKDRRSAQVATNNAVRDGRLKPWPVCAVPECDCSPEAHHPDYSRPLDVVWLCDKHHKAAHKLGREINRGKT